MSRTQHGGRLALIASFALVAACASDEAVELRDWSLAIDGQDAGSLSTPARLRGPLSERPATIRLRTRVELPPEWRGDELVLAIPAYAGLAHASADGVPLASLRADDSSYRRADPHSWRVPASLTAGASLALEITLAHTWTQSAWLLTTPRLVAGPAEDAYTARVRAVNAIGAIGVLAVLSTLALLYAGLFALDRRREEFALLSAQLTVSAAYPLYLLGLGQGLLGRFDLALATLLMALSGVFAIHAIHARYELAPPSRLWSVAVGAIAMACAVWSGPFTIAPYATAVGNTVMGLIIGYNIWLLAKLTRQRRSDAEIHLGAWCAIGVTGIPDLGVAFGSDLLGGYRIATYGFAVFAIAQFTALARSFMRQLNRTEELNEQLRARMTEIDELNRALGREVAERSRQLGDALARFAHQGDVRAELAVGTLVHGRYRITERMGQGGMGAVYAAERLRDGARVALKVVRSDRLEHVPRLAREAEHACEIHHSNVVRVQDVDVADDGRLYLVMELIDGTTLRAEGASRSLAWRMEAVRQIAAGLAAIHEAGVIHRDLKPDNILVAGDRIKITDFGISASTGARVALGDTTPMPAMPSPGSGARERLTRTGTVLGTPTYIAPEQLAQGRGDAASDVFSLGVVALELLAGGLPFEQPAAMLAIRSDPQIAPAQVVALLAEVDAPVRDAVARCLALEPAARPTAAELVTLLAPRPVLANEPRAASEALLSGR